MTAPCRQRNARRLARSASKRGLCFALPSCVSYAAWTACEYWRQRKGGDALQYARPSSAAAAEWQLDAAVHNLRKLRRESVRCAENRGNVGVTAGKAA